ncbi:MAG: hypothetical protein NZM44_07365, partial [Candidatus Calescibacterium sp.]|nr:hypothetical protein [Candidatus Calescibacterium sp.]
MYKSLIITIICVLTIISISYAGVSISPVNVNVNSISRMNSVHIQTISISPVYIRPISISGVNTSTSISAYNPSLMINKVSISTSANGFQNRASQINRVYINHYNPYKILKQSYQNIRVSYYNSNT